MGNTKEGLKNLLNSVKSGDIKMTTAIKMITGGHVGSGFLPTIGKKGPGTPLRKKAKGGSVNKKGK
jgi:hypothetical protein